MFVSARLTAALVVFLTVSACDATTEPEARATTTSESVGSDDTDPVPDLPDDPIRAVLVLLTTPETAEEGIRMLFAHIGIGVYAADGTPVTRGSERGPNDFIVYDFQVPGLAAMHRGRPWTFDDLSTLYSRLGLETTTDELAEVYRRAYERQDEVLPRFVIESGLDFDGDSVAFTPLSAWLMVLDALIPPRPPVGSDVRVVPIATTSCDISGRAPSGWGFVAGAAADFADLVVAEEAFRALNAVTLAESMWIETNMPPSVHEGHGSKGDETTLTASLVAYWQPTPVPVTCGYLTAWPISGDLTGSMITWTIPAAASLHGTFESSSQTEHTSPSPSDLIFRAREEPSNGEGPPTEVSLDIGLEADPKVGLAAHGVDPATLAMMRSVTAGHTLKVEFHGELWDFEMSGGFEGETGEVKRAWRGRFRVDADELHGLGEVGVSGSVVCFDTETRVPFSGTVPFEISGVATEGELVVNLQHGTPDIAYIEEVPGSCADPDSLFYMDEFEIEQLAYEDLEAFHIIYPEALTFPRDGGEETLTSLFGADLDAEIVRTGS